MKKQLKLHPHTRLEVNVLSWKQRRKLKTKLNLKQKLKKLTQGIKLLVRFDTVQYTVYYKLYVNFLFFSY